MRACHKISDYPNVALRNLVKSRFGIRNPKVRIPQSTFQNPGTNINPESDRAEE